jgi:hypothetical protein
MRIASYEWSVPTGARALPKCALDVRSHAQGGPTDDGMQSAAATYHALMCARPSAEARGRGAALVDAVLAGTGGGPCALPDSPNDLLQWMRRSAQAVAAEYAQYLQARKEGAPRRYFSNRAHALHFLRCVAPTKLVDGAWLYGLLCQGRDPRFAHLVTTYLEELGCGDPDKNHVLLYRKLMARCGIDMPDDLPETLYVQGATQLGLAWNPERFLPEIIGFNLGYEQLPLHLLITSYELNELAIDPYYFQLHVTVDNTDTGHAHRACEAVRALMPQLGDADAFWARVRNGSRLADAGAGTTQVIGEFDIEHEVCRILAHKSAAGRGAHSDYCKVAGRSVNDWLADPAAMPGFIAALRKAGWIKLGEPASASRFWGLLQGERADMFGVFNAYELQVIHDWLRGPASVDGMPYSETGLTDTRSRRPSFRAAERSLRMAASCGVGGRLEVPALDPDLDALRGQLPGLDLAGRLALLASAMSPTQHWTPSGLYATREFCEQVYR